MKIKRMRVFAGPNGSGKSTSLKGILSEKEINLGVYVNADDIEKELLTNSNRLDLAPFKIIVDNNHLQDFFRNSKFSPLRRNEPDLWQKISIDQNILEANTNIDSYLAADIAEFLRQNLLNNGISFTYETVMSHPDKIDFMAEATNKGYRVYLYFLATEDPDINISRVNLRVSQHGHSVDPQKIKDRYYKSLKNLKPAILNSYRAFIFDNSGEGPIYIGEISNGVDVVLTDTNKVPKWVDNYLFNN